MRSRTSFDWEPLEDQARQDALQAILKSWEGTKYQAGQRAKQGGVDCVHFVRGVLGEMTGRYPESPKKVAQDASWHSPKTTFATLREFLSLYEPVVVVNFRRDPLRPGDVIVTAPIAGGPGHAMIVGCRPGVIWHAVEPRVMQVGLPQALVSGRKILHCYRTEGWII